MCRKVGETVAKGKISKKNNKKAKKRIFLSFIFFGAIIGSLSYSFFTNVGKIIEIKNEKQALNVKLSDLKDEEEALNSDIKKLNDITIPKPKVVEKEIVPKKKVNFTIVFLLVFILVVAMFFFFNPEVINGKNVYYTCSKSYDHEKLPASVIENVELEFNGHGTIIDIKVKSDYIFNDVNYYKEFRDKSYFYQYFSDGDTYKFDDNTYTYKLFSSINTKEDFFLPTDKDGLIKHYQDDNYTCKVVDN